MGLVVQQHATSEKLRFIEFFAGIGGFAACCNPHEIAAAIDIDQAAKRVYQSNFTHNYFNVTLESVEAVWLESLAANAWWLSPPCQPFSRRGKQEDLRDPRSLALKNLFQLVPCLRPKWILLENVSGFAVSEMFAWCCSILNDAGYVWQTLDVCPSAWGWPNRRPRFYLMATTEMLPDWHSPPRFECKWREFVSDDFGAELAMSDEFVQKFGSSLDRLTKNRESEPTACFGSSYGVVTSGAGSYLEYEPGKFRRFSPREVLRLLGYPEQFVWDETLTLKKQWKLAGNSLSLPVIRYLVNHLPQAACS